MLCTQRAAFPREPLKYSCDTCETGETTFCGPKTRHCILSISPQVLSDSLGTKIRDLIDAVESRLAQIFLDVQLTVILTVPEGQNVRSRGKYRVPEGLSLWGVGLKPRSPVAQGSPLLSQQVDKPQGRDTWGATREGPQAGTGR